MPRPHNGARCVLHGDDGVAVLDFVGGDMEVDIRVGAGVSHRQAVYDAALVCPHDACLCSRIRGVLYVDVGRGDVFTGMILEVCQNIITSILGLIGSAVDCPVLDGVAIYERDFVIPRCGDEVRVGGVTLCGIALEVVLGQVVGTAR